MVRRTHGTSFGDDDSSGLAHANAGYTIVHICGVIAALTALLEIRCKTDTRHRHSGSSSRSTSSRARCGCSSRSGCGGT